MPLSKRYLRAVQVQDYSNKIKEEEKRKKNVIKQSNNPIAKKPEGTLNITFRKTEA